MLCNKLMKELGSNFPSFQTNISYEKDTDIIPSEEQTYS